MAILSVALRKTSNASSKSMPWIVIEVELRWKLRWPWMHLQRLMQLLIGVLLLRVVVNLVNFPKYLLSSQSR